MGTCSCVAHIATMLSIDVGLRGLSLATTASEARGSEAGRLPRSRWAAGSGPRSGERRGATAPRLRTRRQSSHDAADHSLG